MPYFRKRPVVIEAQQMSADPDIARVQAHWCGGTFSTSPEGRGAFITIPTLEGDHRALPGDWIIKGVKGEFYPCKDEIFRATYEETTDYPEPSES